MKNSKPDSTNETGRRQQLPPAELENRLNPITNQLQKIVAEFERIQTQNAEFADKLKAALKEAEDDDSEYRIISMSSGSDKYRDGHKIMTIEQMVKNLHREFLRSHYDDNLKNIVFIFDKNRLSDNEIKVLGTFKNVMVEEKKAEPKKDFEVGKWYKNRIDSVRCRFTEKGSLNSGYVIFDWKNNISMTDLKNWQEMTPKQIELLLTERCEELGLFDGEFECLTGLTFSNNKEGLIQYWEEELWIGGNLAYEKGKFAKLIEKPKAKEQPKRYILRGITDAGFKRYNTTALHQLVTFINKELPQNFDIIPDAEYLVLEEIPPAK